MEISFHLKAISLAVLVAGVGLSSAFATARALRRGAMRDSHQLPVEENWIETSDANIAGARHAWASLIPRQLRGTVTGARRARRRGADLHGVR